MLHKMDLHATQDGLRQGVMHAWPGNFFCTYLFCIIRLKSVRSQRRVALSKALVSCHACKKWASGARTAFPVNFSSSTSSVRSPPNSRSKSCSSGDLIEPFSPATANLILLMPFETRTRRPCAAGCPKRLHSGQCKAPQVDGVWV